MRNYKHLIASSVVFLNFVHCFGLMCRKLTAKVQQKGKVINHIISLTYSDLANTSKFRGEWFKPWITCIKLNTGETLLLFVFYLDF